MAEHFNYNVQGPVIGLPPSPVPTPIGAPMQRSISSPGPQLPPSYTDAQLSQYLNVNGSRFSPSLQTTVPASSARGYAPAVIKPQNWLTMATSQNINLDSFIASYPMNVCLPEPIIRYLTHNGPAPSPAFLPGWMAKAQYTSRNVQPLPNPCPASANMISNVEYMDTTDFSQVPLTSMDARFALPAPGPLPSYTSAYSPDPYGSVGTFVGACM